MHYVFMLCAASTFIPLSILMAMFESHHGVCKFRAFWARFWVQRTEGLLPPWVLCAVVGKVVDRK